jgi:hypothetical protein
MEQSAGMNISIIKKKKCYRSIYCSLYRTTTGRKEEPNDSTP